MAQESTAQRQRQDIQLRPRADIYETEEGIVLEVEMPGADKETIEVNVDDNWLTVKGRRVKTAASENAEVIYEERAPTGIYAREFLLGPEVDRDSVKASYQNGVLTITLGRKQEAQPKKIPVE